MAIPDPSKDIHEELGEGDLTTTAQVLSAREILDRLESEAADQHEAEPSPDRAAWWTQVLAWVGLK